MNQYNRLTLWGTWVLSTMTGALLILLLSITFRNDWFRLFPLLVAVNFAVVGSAQWFVLRRLQIATLWWVGATTASGCLGGVMSWLAAILTGFLLGRLADAVIGPFPIDLGGAAGFMGGGLILGSCLGIGQWLVLRRYLPRAGWWIVISTIAILLASIVGPLVSRSGIGGFPFSAYLSVLLASFILGATTGWLLLRLVAVRHYAETSRATQLT